MLRELSWEELLEWKAFDDISPLGDRRGDWQAASIASVIRNNLLLQAGMGDKLTSPSDFLLEFKTQEERQEEKAVAPPPTAPPPAGNWQQMKLFARMHTALANADVERRKKGHRNRKA